MKRQALLIWTDFLKQTCLLGDTFLVCGLARLFIFMYKSLISSLENMKKIIREIQICQFCCWWNVCKESLKMTDRDNMCAFLISLPSIITHWDAVLKLLSLGLLLSFVYLVKAVRDASSSQCIYTVHWLCAGGGGHNARRCTLHSFPSPAGERHVCRQRQWLGGWG